MDPGAAPCNLVISCTLASKPPRSHDLALMFQNFRGGPWTPIVASRLRHLAPDHFEKSADGPDSIRQLHGLSRITPEAVLVPDRHGSTRQFLTSQNCRVGLPEPQDTPERSRNYEDRHGVTRRLHGSHSLSYQIHREYLSIHCRLTYLPANVWYI
ncbi:hypothetical protein DPMN_095347 [Dreissena polymorpha]|uniref:Uncharacterized protein n=1 Tax=Dreissena polymorpha TaxID=45954 RepID=A0A9D4R2N0_DREPO|nr:hypothetical protein DPMN_095347 [Dreissena polymorpha]